MSPSLPSWAPRNRSNTLPLQSHEKDEVATVVDKVVVVVVDGALPALVRGRVAVVGNNSDSTNPSLLATCCQPVLSGLAPTVQALHNCNWR